MSKTFFEAAASNACSLIKALKGIWPIITGLFFVMVLKYSFSSLSFPIIKNIWPSNFKFLNLDSSKFFMSEISAQD